MPLYFIDTDGGDAEVRDEAGHNLPDDRAARQLAMDAIADMTGDRLGDGDRRVFAARVHNTGGTLIYAGQLSLTGEWLRLPTQPSSGLSFSAAVPLGLPYWNGHFPARQFYPSSSIGTQR